ncbi:hypothetical protein EVAR_34730_1 [Eumeta japonica]|uniref:Reverse transcriptase domain-containing protein n=1 Tax=Eumeta variegata TaxID=151549 RepID=A0A4C1XE80_EUMVA|nr:hypothetical protein EVAR_34730_1 [Eumeta japonica]
MSRVIRALFLDDDPSQDTVYHMQVQLTAVMVPSGRDAVPLVGTELEKIVGSLPKTARDLDGITYKIVKYVWKAVHTKFCILLDMSETVDNAWSSMLMTKVKRGGLPPNLYKLLIVYFFDRKLPFPVRVKVMAYADVVTVLAEAPSRSEIEGWSRVALDQIREWGRRNRLGFSPAKS